MKNAPKRIFLQLGEDVDTEITDWNEIHPECVSWCTERINENDLEFVAVGESSQQLERITKIDEPYAEKHEDGSFTIWTSKKSYEMAKGVGLIKFEPIDNTVKFKVINP